MNRAPVLEKNTHNQLCNRFIF